MKDAGKKFIPYEKLSKREKRKADLMQRGTWYGVDPVTKRVESGKRYNAMKNTETALTRSSKTLCPHNANADILRLYAKLYSCIQIIHILML